jgi:hypothetical protein
LISKDDIFEKRPPELKKLYLQIEKIIKTFGKSREETLLPDVTFFKTKSTFLAIKVKRDHLDIEFFLDHLENVPPVSKFLQTSKHRVAHIVPIDDPADINEQLIKWMETSYLLISQ